MSYDEEGKLRSVFNYTDGVLNGAFKRFSKGIVIEEGGYKAGNKHGVWKYYEDRPGLVTSEGSYENGEKTGRWKEFNKLWMDENDFSYSVGTYLLGKRTGKWEFFKGNGTLVKRKPIN